MARHLLRDPASGADASPEPHRVAPPGRWPRAARVAAVSHSLTASLIRKAAVTKNTVRKPMVDSTASPPRRGTTFAARLLGQWLFIATALLPTLAAALYFGVWASDVYVSESRFVVRSPERQSVSPLGLIFKGAGFTRAQDDAYTIQDFIHSRDAMAALDATLAIRAAYAAPTVDWFSRFGTGPAGASTEAFHPYYQRKVLVLLDNESSIAVLTTRAFSAEAAQAMNRRLLELSEDLVNQLNERGRQDLIRHAAVEVEATQKKAAEVALALAAFRNQQGVIDPERQSSIPLQQVARLQEELLEARTQVATLERLAKDNPQLPVFRDRVRMLQAAINRENANVAGRGNRSLADKAAEFQRLSLEKEFADRMLASAMSTLEQARSEAQRKQLYLERIVQPSLPDEPMEPRRLRNVIVTAAIAFAVWGILALLLAGVREHHD
jgi:capsular polysaccharide transport system permease protein